MQKRKQDLKRLGTKRNIHNTQISFNSADRIDTNEAEKDQLKPRKTRYNNSRSAFSDAIERSLVRSLSKRKIDPAKQNLTAIDFAPIAYLSSAGSKNQKIRKLLSARQQSINTINAQQADKELCKKLGIPPEYDNLVPVTYNITPNGKANEQQEKRKVARARGSYLMREPLPVVPEFTENNSSARLKMTNSIGQDSFIGGVFGNESSLGDFVPHKTKQLFRGAAETPKSPTKNPQNSKKRLSEYQKLAFEALQKNPSKKSFEVYNAYLSTPNANKQAIRACAGKICKNGINESRR